jgi:hypothetical protein
MTKAGDDMKRGVDPIGRFVDWVGPQVAKHRRKKASMSGHRDDIVTISRELWDVIAESLIITIDQRLLIGTGLSPAHMLTEAQVDELARLGVEP